MPVGGKKSVDFPVRHHIAVKEPSRIPFDQPHAGGIADVEKIQMRRSAAAQCNRSLTEQADQLCRIRPWNLHSADLLQVPIFLNAAGADEITLGGEQQIAVNRRIVYRPVPPFPQRLQRIAVDPEQTEPA